MRLLIDKDTLAEFWKARFKPIDESEKSYKEENSELWEGQLSANSEYAELPEPLESTSFSILSEANRIQYGFELVFRDIELTLDLSKVYAKEILPTRRTFYSTSPDLTGYLLDGENNCVADIVAYKERPESRFVSFGQYGSRIRKYNRLGDLTLDIAELGAITTSVINCCVKKYFPSKKRVVLPHIDINFGLNLD